jgi:hypothetical protein
MGKEITNGPDSIYVDLKQSKYADPPGQLEDRWVVGFSDTILGISGCFSDDTINWPRFVKRALEKDPEIPYSGNCYLCVNEIAYVSSKFSPYSNQDQQDGAIGRPLEDFFSSSYVTANNFV